MSLEKLTKYFLFVAAFTPLIYTSNLLFPFITGKTLFFRLAVSVALVLFVWLLSKNIDIRCRYFRLMKQPLVILILLFFVSLIISSVLAVSSYSAFWSNLERGEGLFTMLHFLAFFLISTTVFSKSDWRTFVKLSLIVGLIIAFYGILQSLGIRWFPGAFEIIRARPWSTLGNSSFIGGYFVMILGLAMWLREGYRVSSGHPISKFWKNLALITAIISVIMIFLSASRGAMVALFVGAVIWIIYKNLTKFNFVRLFGVIVILVLLVGGFWFTRTLPIWQKIPGLDRLSILSLSHPTVQTRLISLGTSWEAFKEKPIFGWGPENFIVAYNKHYNPKYALYEAAWFDRSHNKLADIWVMQGLFGLLTYLGIFVVAFWCLLRRGIASSFASLTPRNDESAPSLRGSRHAADAAISLLILLLMYFIQNLFVFDYAVSYLLFFSVLGIVVGMRTEIATVAEGRPRNDEDVSLRGAERRSNLVWSTMAIAITFALIYSAYAYNYVVFRQSRLFLSAIQTVDNVNVFSAQADDFLVPYNYSQSTVRSQLMDFLIAQDIFKMKEPAFVELGDKALSAMEEYVNKQGVDPRDYIRLSEAYNDRAQSDPMYFQKSEDVLRRALELAPKRQEVYYHLAFTLVGAGKGEEAVELVREAVELAPEVARAHYMLGVILSLVGDRVEGQKEVEKALEIDEGLFLMGQDFQNLLEIYGKNFVYHINKRDLAGIEKAVARLKQFQPEAVSALDKLLELARQGRWEELDAEVSKIITQ